MIEKLSDIELGQLIDNRWNDSSTLWDIVEKSYISNKKLWQNRPDSITKIPEGRSKARANRIFLGTESVITNLTAKPSKPDTLPHQDTEEAKVLAGDLDDFFIEKYKNLGLKEKMRRNLRKLFFSRLMVFKIIWDEEQDDFDIKIKDPRNVRFSKNATSMFDTEFAVEKCSIPLLELFELFSEKKEAIIKKTGYNEKQAMIENPQMEYYEAWIDGWVIYKFYEIILCKEKHPYWDWDGLRMTANELSRFKEANGGERRVSAKIIQNSQTERKSSERKYKQYLYNYFDKPIPPYVFGTILADDDKPVGDTSLIEEVESLQEEINKRKQQISDNAEMVKGVWKFDTELVKGVSKGEAQLMASKAKTGGVIYGHGVRNGVTIDTGRDLPAFVKDDLIHSTNELESIFGTQPTFRGEQGRQETATGRAILREQSYQRLDELISLIDEMHRQIYGWWFQMVKVKYTDKHLTKLLGQEKALRIIELMRDDLNEGLEIRVLPGQILPEDTFYKSERAKEEVIAGIIDPLTYFEETKRDNPEKAAKRLIMWKLNPFSVVPLTPEDQQALAQAQQLLGGGQDQKAQQLAEIRQQAEDLMASPEFQNQPPEIQRQAMEQIRGQINNLTQAK